MRQRPGPASREALASERASQLRYTEHSDAASRALAPDAAVELLRHADERQLHVQQLTQRILELGGAVEPGPDAECDLGPGYRGPPKRPEGRAQLLELIREDIVAEYVMIDNYGEMRRRLGESDPISGGMLEALLAIGELQGMRLIRLLRSLEPAPRPVRERTERQPRGEPR